MTLGQAGLRRVAVFCGGSGAAKPAHKEAAAAVGQLLARRGISLVYGGGNVGPDGRRRRRRFG